MKTTIFQSVFCILVIATAVLSSCIKEDLPVTGTISGTISAYDPTTPLVKTPVEGIKVYLINADYKFNTTTYAGNSAALIDSTLSDAKGNYRFTNIPLGRYNVFPIPYSNGYRFKTIPTGKIDPLQITESSLDHNINFASPLPNNNNYEPGPYKINLYIHGNEQKIASFFERYRYAFFIIPIPQFTMVNGVFQVQKFMLTGEWRQDFSFYAEKAEWWCGETNSYLFKFYDSNGVWVGWYSINLDLVDPTHETTWRIDLNARTVKKD